MFLPQVGREVSDDGQGIDADKTRTKIENAGYLAPADAQALTPPQVYGYLFEPGFTTASEVSEYSSTIGWVIQSLLTRLLRLLITIESQRSARDAGPRSAGMDGQVVVRGILDAGDHVGHHVEKGPPHVEVFAEFAIDLEGFVKEI